MASLVVMISHFHFSSERRPSNSSQANLVSGGTFWSASTSQETVAREFKMIEKAISPIITARHQSNAKLPERRNMMKEKIRKG